MNLKRITADSEEFKEVWKIYDSSFPSEMRRELNQQVELLNHNTYGFFAAYDNGLVGLLATWEFDDFIFIEHIAIREELRGKGLGTKLLNDFIAKQNKKIVLETERPGDLEKGRISFYERAGFKPNAHKYIQPAYSKEKEPVPLILMTYPKEITEDEFVQVREKLHKVVYGLEKPLI